MAKVRSSPGALAASVIAPGVPAVTSSLPPCANFGRPERVSVTLWAVASYVARIRLESHLWDSNPGPQLYESCALPTELRWHVALLRSRSAAFTLKPRILAVNVDAPPYLGPATSAR